MSEDDLERARQRLAEQLLQELHDPEHGPSIARELGVTRSATVSEVRRALDEGAAQLKRDAETSWSDWTIFAMLLTSLFAAWMGDGSRFHMENAGMFVSVAVWGTWLTALAVPRIARRVGQR